MHTELIIENFANNNPIIEISPPWIRNDDIVNIDYNTAHFSTPTMEAIGAKTYAQFRKQLGDVYGYVALEIGVGPGNTSKILAEEGAKRVILTDVSEPFLYQARRNMAFVEAQTAFSFAVLDPQIATIDELAVLGTKPGSVDLITYWGAPINYMLDNVDNTLQVAKNLLTDNGQLIIQIVTDNNITYNSPIVQNSLRKFNAGWFADHQVLHKESGLGQTVLPTNPNEPIPAKFYNLAKFNSVLAKHGLVIHKDSILGLGRLVPLFPADATNPDAIYEFLDLVKQIDYNDWARLAMLPINQVFDEVQKLDEEKSTNLNYIDQYVYISFRVTKTNPEH